MRIHLVGLPHTETTKAYSWCAFTEKTRKLASMLTDTGYDVRLYAGEANEARATEHVALVDRAWQTGHFGRYDWSRDVFNEFDSDSPHWTDFNARAIAAIRERAEPGDVLAITMGLSQKPIADALPHLTPVEVGIGYPGVWAPFQVIESHAWEHFLAARRPSDDARFYDAVIPNSFELEDFPAGKGDGGYYLFVGRFIQRKGIQIAVEATARAGVKLVMAGQGVLDHTGDTYRGIDVEVSGPHLRHVGVVGPEARARLYGGAIAVLAPSIYLEPFCGVSAEAQLCGTPVISTDWGALVENVEEGVSGFRCRTLSEFVRAIDAVEALDRDRIRERAAARWSTDVVRHRYDAYFKKLATLAGDGWYTLP